MRKVSAHSLTCRIVGRLCTESTVIGNGERRIHVPKGVGVIVDVNTVHYSTET